MTEQQQTPWLPVAGHLSGSGSYRDAPTPPGIPATEPTGESKGDDQ